MKIEDRIMKVLEGGGRPGMDGDLLNEAVRELRRLRVGKETGDRARLCSMAATIASGVASADADMSPADVADRALHIVEELEVLIMSSLDNGRRQL